LEGGIGIEVGGRGEGGGRSFVLGKVKESTGVVAI